MAPVLKDVPLAWNLEPWEYQYKGARMPDIGTLQAALSSDGSSA